MGGIRTRVTRAPLAELDVVDVLGDRRVLAADRAGRVAAYCHLVDRRPERVQQKEPALQRVADPEQELERLVRLQRPDDPGQDAEHAALGAARRELGRGRGWGRGSVARALAGVEDGHLALEAVDRAVHHRDVVPDRRVVDEVAGVRAVDDHVPAVAEDALDVLGREPLLVRSHVHVR